jgi:hypothetical protein
MYKTAAFINNFQKYKKFKFLIIVSCKSDFLTLNVLYSNKDSGKKLASQIRYKSITYVNDKTFRYLFCNK